MKSVLLIQETALQPDGLPAGLGWPAFSFALSVFVCFVVSFWAVNAPAAPADSLPVVSATASANDGNVPANAIDGSMTSRWSAQGDGQWISFDLGTTATVGSVRIAWYKGNVRRSKFDIQTSANGTAWTTVFSGQSGGTTTDYEAYDVTDSAARYVRVVGHGNSSDMWNSLIEAKVDAPGAVIPPTGTHLTITWPGGTTGSPMVSLLNAEAGSSYLLQTSTNMKSWVDTGQTFTNASAVQQTWLDNVNRPTASATTARYYRVKRNTPPPPVNLPTIAKAFSTVQLGAKKMPYWRNRPIDQYDPRVTRAIIVIHGSGGNAEGYFDRINNVIPSSWGNHVMVISPWFQTPSDASSGEWYWDDDWREGGASGGLSSYAALDGLITQMRNGNFPNLKWIVLCGHSAGGQTTQRYAAFTDIDMHPEPNSQFIKFVPANPSSYVYLNQYRNPEGDSSWVIPAQECSSGDGYNEWKYGLDNLYGYTAARGADWARAKLPARQIELLAGTADNFDNGDMDTDCGAEWQGPFRYQRAHIFKMFMDRYYPANHFSITDVPGVDHDSTRMFASSQGVNAIFFPD